MRSTVFAFYLQDWNEGFNEWNELNPLSPPPPSVAPIHRGEGGLLSLQKNRRSKAEELGEAKGPKKSSPEKTTVPVFRKSRVSLKFDQNL